MGQNVGNPENDQEVVPHRLSAELFAQLLKQANTAYSVITELGPFYGQEHIKEPTFRITAQPVVLPQSAKVQLATFGNDVLLLGKAIQQLPEVYRQQLGDGLDYHVPFTWRVDAIFNEKGNISINELEGVDGANALMMAEQFAYDLQSPDKSTAAHVISTVRAMCGITNPQEICKVALLKVNNPHIVNAKRFVEMIADISHNTLILDLFLEEELRNGISRPVWQMYHGILNEASFSPSELLQMGIEQQQILFSGSYIALINKGLFALVFDPSLEKFWEDRLGLEVLGRLKTTLIPSRFITSVKDIDTARAQGKVVKASWAGKETSIINRGRGVALPSGNVEQSSDERWNYLKELFSQGVHMIAQDFVLPGRISAYLRKKGTNLEQVNWYNRICIKYVCDGDPSKEPLPSVSITALEATLGPEVVPAGRKCAFTAATFEK